MSAVQEVKPGKRYPLAVRKFIFPLFIGSALLVALCVCWVIWKQDREHKELKRQAQEIASGLGGTAFLNSCVGEGSDIPADLEGVLAQFDPGWEPENPLTGKPLVEVGLFQQTQPFDITYLRGKSRTAWVAGTDEEGRQTFTELEDQNSPVVIVYGPPGFKGLDIDGDSLPDSVLAYYPEGPINATSGMHKKTGGGLASRYCEPLEQTVRRERDRLLAAGVDLGPPEPNKKDKEH